MWQQKLADPGDDGPIAFVAVVLDKAFVTKVTSAETLVHFHASTCSSLSTPILLNTSLSFAPTLQRICSPCSRPSSKLASRFAQRTQPNSCDNGSTMAAPSYPFPLHPQNPPLKLAVNSITLRHLHPTPRQRALLQKLTAKSCTRARALLPAACQPSCSCRRIWSSACEISGARALQPIFIRCLLLSAKPPPSALSTTPSPAVFFGMMAKFSELCIPVTRHLPVPCIPMPCLLQFATLFDFSARRPNLQTRRQALLLTGTA